jgi:DNA polymerase I-like protein with 3'-5' exonuclease and polymerase domains
LHRGALSPPQLVSWGILYCSGATSSVEIDGDQAAQLPMAALGILVDDDRRCFIVPLCEGAAQDGLLGSCLDCVEAMFESDYVKVSWGQQASFRRLYAMWPHMMPTNLFDPRIACWIVDSEWKGRTSCGHSGFTRACITDSSGSSALLADDSGGVGLRLLAFGSNLQREVHLARHMFAQILQQESESCVRTCVANEMASSAILARMERTGIGLSVDSLHACRVPMVTEIARLEAEVRQTPDENIWGATRTRPYPDPCIVRR